MGKKCDNRNYRGREPGDGYPLSRRMGATPDIGTYLRREVFKTRLGGR